MNEKKIKIEVVVFNDDTYCETGSREEGECCPFLQYFYDDDETRCYLFPVKQGELTLSRKLVMDWQTMQYIKCDQCKIAFKKSLEIPKKPPEPISRPVIVTSI